MDLSALNDLPLASGKAHKWQGTTAEMIAAAWFSARGCEVSLPIGELSRYDLVVEIANTLYRVEVKSTTTSQADLRTRRLDKATEKRLSTKDSDFVAVVAMPSGAVTIYETLNLQGKSSIAVRHPGPVV